MAWDHQEFQESLVVATEAYDVAAVSSLIDDLVGHLYSTDDVYPNDAAKRVMKLLRRKRLFAEMERTGDALLRTGQDAAGVRSLHAQSLLDQGKLAVGIAVLEQLVADTGDDPAENAEATGLLGRASKQAYMDAGSSTTKRSHDDLRTAIKWYYTTYDGDRSNIWHGINTVALLKRAARDGVETDGYPDPDEIAASILTEVKNRRADGKADAWDFGTAAEACLALGKHDEALEWTRRYVDGSGADAFELASTLRQLEEVWGLLATEEPGRRLLPYLRTELLQREDGCVDLDAGTAEAVALAELARDEDGTFEGVLGTESFQNVKWLAVALSRAASIARIDDKMEATQGTAFVVRAKDMGVESVDDDELLLVTNSHVISEIASQSDVLRPSDVTINFEMDELEESLEVKEVVKESGRNDLDFTLFRTDPPVTDREPIPLARAVPVLGQRVYIIGHPAGGRLKYSIYDNHLLNHVPPFLHYRTPTKGGSSGSPVMNKNWELIGLHHVGDKKVVVPDQEGRHPANEGIVAKNIKERIGEG